MIVLSYCIDDLCIVEFVQLSYVTSWTLYPHFFCRFIAMDKKRFWFYTLMKLLLNLKWWFEPSVGVTVSVMYDVAVFVMRVIFKINILC